MRVFVDITEVERGQLIKAPSHFGQPCNLADLDYKITYEVFEFLAEIGPAYKKVIDFLREDDAAFDDFDAPYEGAEDYPTLEDFLKMEGRVEEFSEFVGYWCRDALLDVEEIPDKTIYVANSIDEICLVGDEVIIRGKAYLPPPNPYKGVAFEVVVFDSRKFDNLIEEVEKYGASCENPTDYAPYIVIRYSAKNCHIIRQTLEKGATKGFWEYRR